MKQLKCTFRKKERCQAWYDLNGNPQFPVLTMFEWDLDGILTCKGGIVPKSKPYLAGFLPKLLSQVG